MLWMFVDCLLRKFSSIGQKIFWVLVIIFLPPFGACVYLLGIVLPAWWKQRRFFKEQAQPKEEPPALLREQNTMGEH
ncbi:PLDc N-terminal domain-containing protein [Thermosporothrix hazakensis]|jgi:hypothetical protein|uniref:PLDc N-terminal domain-containing protein n=1 Tax=Thermosporothrix hazakensis TaxID=644383 RepID=UPI000DAD0B25|nr:PLD nuclease N-terminal domain-containing protein [Thermosporothrix hazakensis]